jgi:hypothetical protein
MYVNLKKIIKKLSILLKIKKELDNPKDTPFLRSLCYESNSVEEYFWKASQQGNDDRKFSINELLPVIRMITESNNIQTAAEFGTAQCRVSSALLLGGVKKLYSVDITKDEVVNHFEELCNKEKLNFEFILEDSAKYELQNVDLLFIDSLHNREHLREELKNHTNVGKLIVMHDTETFKELGDQGGGLKFEIDNFLDKNPEWTVLYEFKHNNGMMVLSKI